MWECNAQAAARTCKHVGLSSSPVVTQAEKLLTVFEQIDERLLMYKTMETYFTDIFHRHMLMMCLSHS